MGSSVENGCGGCLVMLVVAGAAVVGGLAPIGSQLPPSGGGSGGGGSSSASTRPAAEPLPLILPDLVDGRPYVPVTATTVGEFERDGRRWRRVRFANEGDRKLLDVHVSTYREVRLDGDRYSYPGEFRSNFGTLEPGYGREGDVPAGSVCDIDVAGYKTTRYRVRD